MAKVRELGIRIGSLETGPKNCITDVSGVAVGHRTLDNPLADGDYACTGVTAVVPHGGNLFREKVVGACHVFNGFGKTTGLVQVKELGTLEAPILLTNTFSVPAASQGLLEYMLAAAPEIGDTTGTINTVVAECNDMTLNSIRAMAVEPSHAREALAAASLAAATEGAVGAGKGMTCFGCKGGIGSSSRLVVGEDGGAFTLGVLVLSNFGRREDFRHWQYQLEPSLKSAVRPATDGSIIMVLATDAPLDSRRLERLCKRCGVGLARTGSHYSNGSGDIAIGFSTAVRVPHGGDMPAFAAVREDGEIMDMLFAAAADATEEAILNSMSQAVATTGRNGTTVYPYDFRGMGEA